MWVPRNGAREVHVPRVSGLVQDRRARHYWDGHDAVQSHFDEMLDLTGPCAGIFAVYGPDVTWLGDKPPVPDYYEDAHAREYNRSGPQFNARRFAQHVREMLNLETL